MSKFFSKFLSKEMDKLGVASKQKNGQESEEEFTSASEENVPDMKSTPGSDTLSHSSNEVPVVKEPVIVEPKKDDETVSNSSTMQPDSKEAIIARVQNKILQIKKIQSNNNRARENNDPKKAPKESMKKTTSMKELCRPNEMLKGDRKMKPGMLPVGSSLASPNNKTINKPAAEVQKKAPEAQQRSTCSRLSKVESKVAKNDNKKPLPRRRHHFVRPGFQSIPCIFRKENLSDPNHMGCNRKTCQYTHEREKSCHIDIMETMLEAKNTIDVCMYQFTDQHIAKMLIRLSKNLIIRIITSDVYEPLHDKIPLLHQSGIKVKHNREQEHYIHHKFTVIDRKTLIKGSSNFTMSGLQSSFNVVEILDDETEAERYLKEFDFLWSKCVFYSPKSRVAN